MNCVYDFFRAFWNFQVFKELSISGSMLNLTHKVWYLYSLRRLANVEMFSVMSCVERRRCRCGFSCLKFKFNIWVLHYRISIINSYFNTCYTADILFNFFLSTTLSFSPWRRANARNVRLYYSYWQSRQPFYILTCGISIVQFRICMYVYCDLSLQLFYAPNIRIACKARPGNLLKLGRKKYRLAYGMF